MKYFQHTDLYTSCSLTGSVTTTLLYQNIIQIFVIIYCIAVNTVPTVNPLLVTANALKANGKLPDQLTDSFLLTPVFYKPLYAVRSELLYGDILWLSCYFEIYLFQLPKERKQ